MSAFLTLMSQVISEKEKNVVFGRLGRDCYFLHFDAMWPSPFCASLLYHINNNDVSPQAAAHRGGKGQMSVTCLHLHLTGT